MSSEFKTMSPQLKDKPFIEYGKHIAAKFSGAADPMERKPATRLQLEGV
jgi:hypothetical protein